MVPGTKWALNKYLWNSSWHLQMCHFKYTTPNIQRPNPLNMSCCFYFFFSFLFYSHGDTSVGYSPCIPIRCPLGCLETIWIRWHDILNYIYLKWDNILTFHYYIIILITEVATVIELFHTVFEQMKIKESLRHNIMSYA